MTPETKLKSFLEECRIMLRAAEPTDASPTVEKAIHMIRVEVLTGLYDEITGASLDADGTKNLLVTRSRTLSEQSDRFANARRHSEAFEDFTRAEYLAELADNLTTFMKDPPNDAHAGEV